MDNKCHHYTFGKSGKQENGYYNNYEYFCGMLNGVSGMFLFVYIYKKNICIEITYIYHWTCI